MWLIHRGGKERQGSSGMHPCPGLPLHHLSRFNRSNRFWIARKPHYRIHPSEALSETAVMPKQKGLSSSGNSTDIGEGEGDWGGGGGASTFWVKA